MLVNTKRNVEMYMKGVNDGYKSFFENRNQPKIVIDDDKSEEEKCYLLGLIEGRDDAREDLDDGVVDEFGISIDEYDED